MCKKKVSAFAIIDLMVALIISSIVTGMAYLVISLFNNGFVSYQRKTSSLNDFFFFEKTWARDWEKARYISDAGNGVWMLEYGPDTTVQYIVRDELMIRIWKENIDSLPVKIAGSKMHQYREGMNILDQVDLDILINNETIHCSYYKRYAAKDLLEITNKNAPGN